jgi:hypothetical protein
MTGYAIAVSACFACGAPFGYNPHRVPSIPVNARGHVDPAGDRKPICRDCASRANVARKASGLKLWDTSDECYAPIPESEL